MKSILDEMEEHIAAIRNLQRNFDFHSKRLEKLMRELVENHLPEDRSDSLEEARSQSETPTSELPSDSMTAKTPASPALEGMGPCLPAGRKGHPIEEKYLIGKPRPLGREASLKKRAVNQRA